MTTNRIYINGRFLTQPITGVQRFAKEILNALDKVLDSNASEDVRFTCLVPKGLNQASLPQWNNINLSPCGIFQGNLWEQADLPIASRDGILLNLCNIGPVTHLNQIVVMHDASVFVVPDAYSLPFKLKYALIMKVLGLISRKIVTISHFSKNELSRYLRINQAKIKVITEGCDHIIGLFENDSQIRNHQIEAPFFLIVGSSSKHKNTGIVRRALESGISTRIKLVVVGGTYSKVFNKDSFAKNRNVVDIGYVTDEELKSLYANATGFIFPSLYEGFGLPPLEAMACGCPVICSNHASLPEVCGDAAYYVNPLEISEIRYAINQLLENNELRKSLISKGNERAKFFTWEKAASQLLDIIQSSTT